MGIEYEFDKTRQAIGGPNLSNEERREMLQKFQEAGGKVLSEKELKEKAAKEALISGGGRSSKKGAMLDDADSSTDNRSRRYANYFGTGEEGESIEINSKKAESNKVTFLQGLLIKIQCHVQGISSLPSYSIKYRFFKIFCDEARMTLVDYKHLSLQMLGATTDSSRKIIEKLDAQDPMYIEILEYASTLFQETQFHHIEDLGYTYSKSDVPVSEVDKNIRLFLAKIAPMVANKALLINALKVAINTYEEIDTANAKGTLFLTIKKRMLKHTHILLDTIFPRLVLLLSKVDKKNYKSFTPDFDEAIQYTPVLFGKRIKGDKVKNLNVIQIGEEKNTTEEETIEEEIVEDEEIQGSQEYEYGSNIMKMLSPKILKAKHDPQNKKSSFLHDRDKTFLTYLYYEEFDQEYSFILMTRQLRLEPEVVVGVKVDYVSQLKSIYEDSRHIVRAFEEYGEEVKNCVALLKSSSSFVAGSSHYIERSKLEENSKKKVLASGMNVRKLIKKYMDSVSRIMARFISDLQEEEPKIVQNPGTTVELSVDSNSSVKRRLNNKTIKDCILEVYCYSLAFDEKLSSKELAGSQVEIPIEVLQKVYGPEVEVSVKGLVYA